MVDSLPRRGVQAETDQIGQVQGDEQPDFAGGQTVVSHLTFVGQEGDDVRRRCAGGVRHVVDDFVLQPLQASFLLGTFSSHVARIVVGCGRP